MKSVLLAITLCAWMLSSTATLADTAADEVKLEQLLRMFLAGTEQREVHDGFWADDLVYTSSAGARYGKAEILTGFDNETNTERMAVDYGADDVKIRVFDDFAVITFKLTADEDGKRSGEYYNTGVFRLTGDSWQAFTWQATKIPNP